MGAFGCLGTGGALSALEHPAVCRGYPFSLHRPLEAEVSLEHIRLGLGMYPASSLKKQISNDHFAIISSFLKKCKTSAF